MSLDVSPAQRRCTVVVFLAAVLVSLAWSVHAETEFAGVNLAGAEFAHGTFWPTQQEIDYFSAKGMNVIRVPFLWERLQPTLNSSFDSSQQTNLVNTVNAITAAGAVAILDPHNYARYNNNLVGSAAVPNTAFADLWVRLSGLFGGQSDVIFGLMNEPHSMPTEQWRDAANAAIAAIRNAGADNLILVPGNAWTGAHSWEQNWYGTANGTVMKTIVDPMDNYAFELHQYFDSDFSGRSANCSAGHGTTQLQGVTAWLRSEGIQGFLGEFAGGNNPQCQQAIESVIDYLNSNADVWLGWTWWAAGPEWGEYIFTLEPTNNFTQDRPQLPWLKLDQRGGSGDRLFLDGFEVAP